MLDLYKKYLETNVTTRRQNLSRNSPQRDRRHLLGIQNGQWKKAHNPKRMRNVMWCD